MIILEVDFFQLGALGQGNFERALFLLTSGSSSDRSHVGHEFFLVSLEVFVSKDDWIIWTHASVDLAKAPAVELASEGDELSSLEIVAEDLASKLFGISDDKGLSLGKPGNAERLWVVLVSFLHEVH